MAELLIKAVDYTPDDPALDRGAFKRGDLVVVMPDGWQWGASELDTSLFYIVRFPGVPVEEFERYLEPEYAEPEPVLMSRHGAAQAAALTAAEEGDAPERLEEVPAAPPPPPPALVRVRAWHATGTPEWLQAALDAGPIEAEWEALKAYVRRKADGATPDEA